MTSNEEHARQPENSGGSMTSLDGSCLPSSSPSSSPSSHSSSVALSSPCSSCTALESWSSFSATKTRIRAKPKTTFFLLLLTCADIVAGIPSSPVASSLPLPILGDGPHDLAVHRNASTDEARKHINYHNFILHSFSPPFHIDWRKHERNHALSHHASTMKARQNARQSARHNRHPSDKAKEKTKKIGDSNDSRESGRSSPSSSSSSPVSVNTKTPNAKSINVKGSKQWKSGKKEIFKIHITKGWRNSQTTTTRSPPISPPHPHPSSTPPPSPHPHSPISSPDISRESHPSFSPNSPPKAPQTSTTSSHYSSSLPSLLNSLTSSSLIPSTSALPLPPSSSPTLPPLSSALSVSSPFHHSPFISTRTFSIPSLPPPSQPLHSSSSSFSFSSSSPSSPSFSSSSPSFSSFSSSLSPFSSSPSPSPSPSFSSFPNTSSVKTSIIPHLSTSYSSPSSLPPSSFTSSASYGSFSSLSYSPSPISSSSYSPSSISSSSSSSSSSPPTTEEQADTTMLSGRVLLEMQNFQEAQMLEEEGARGNEVPSKTGDVTHKVGEVRSEDDISLGGSDVFSLGADGTHSSPSVLQNIAFELSSNYSSQNKNALPKVTVNKNHEKYSKHSTADFLNENTVSHYINRESGGYNSNSNKDNVKPTAAALVSGTTGSSEKIGIENIVLSQSESNRTHSNINNQSNTSNSGLVNDLISLISSGNRVNGTNDNITYSYNDSKANREIVDDKIYNSSDVDKTPTHVKLDSLEVELSEKSGTGNDLLLAIRILQHHDLLGLNESYPDATVPDARDFEEEPAAAGDGEAVEEHLRHIAEAAEEAQRSKSGSKDKHRQRLFHSQKEETAYNSLYPFPREASYETTEPPPDISFGKATEELYGGESVKAPPKSTSRGVLHSSRKSGQYEVEVLDSFSPTSDYDFTTYSEEPPGIADDEEVSMQEPETCFLWFVLVMDGNCSVIKPRMNTFVTFLKAALSAKVPLEYEDVHVPSVFCDASFMVNISIDSKKYPDVDERLQSLAAANVTLLEISGEIFYLEKVLTRKDQSQERSLLRKKADDVEIVIYIAVGCMCAFIILSVVIVTLIKICKQDLEPLDLNKPHTLSGNDFPIRRPNVIYSPRFTQDLDPEKYRLRPFDDPLVVESTSRCGGAGVGGGVGGAGGGETNRGGPHLKEDLCPSPLRYGSEQVEEVTIEAPEQFRDDFTPLVDSDANDKDELCEVIFDTPSPRRTRKMNITAMAKRAAAAAAAAATSVRSHESPTLTLDNPCYDR